MCDIFMFHTVCPGSIVNIARWPLMAIIIILQGLCISAPGGGAGDGTDINKNRKQALCVVGEAGIM